MKWRVYLLVFFLVAGAASCGNRQTAPKRKKEEAKKSSFVFRETVVTGTDTAMRAIDELGEVPVSAVLCQVWQPADEPDLDFSSSDSFSIQHSAQTAFFSDSQVVQNTRENLLIGRWRVKRDGPRVILTLQYPGFQKEYLIRIIGNTALSLEEMDDDRPVRFDLKSDGSVHENFYNEPLHPSNLQWRIRPRKRESDSLIYERVTAAVRFFALFYRDNIRRYRSEISFIEQPAIFNWYRGGIGLPDKDEVSISWIRCFYDKRDAMKGYDILHSLIVDYEFQWDSSAPDWVYQTHAVLQQMYHKMEEQRGTWPGKKKKH